MQTLFELEVEVELEGKDAAAWTMTPSVLAPVIPPKSVGILCDSLRQFGRLLKRIAKIEMRTRIVGAIGDRILPDG